MDQAEGPQEKMKPPQMHGPTPGHRSNTQSSEGPGAPGVAPPITLPEDVPTIITDKGAHPDPYYYPQSFEDCLQPNAPFDDESFL